MSRVQLALNVADIDSAVEFYSKLFGAEPAKRQPGYANFAIADPPLKLVLMENAEARESGVAGALNHLGVEVETPDEVTAASVRLNGSGSATIRFSPLMRVGGVVVRICLIWCGTPMR